MGCIFVMYKKTKSWIVTGTSKFLFHYKKRNLKSTEKAESTVFVSAEQKEENWSLDCG